MQDLADTELLRQYADHDSEPAFSALVTRHINLVYSTAIRKTGNPHAAGEITQAVFIILAKKAKVLCRETVLSGWLYQTTRLTAANFLRSEIRRIHREQEAYMQSLSNETETWPQIEPLLEDAMGRLNEKERHAVVLRFFEGKSFQEIGMAFGGSENAAKKRVIRGLEKLRKFFSKHGVSSTTAIIAGMISTHSVQAAPVGLAKTISAVAMVKGATASASTLTLVKGALKIMAWTKFKTATVTVAAIVVATGTTTLVIQHQHQQRPQSKPQLTRVIAPTETDFPRTSWGFAGYANPQSALLSAIWSLSTGDMEKFLTSFTPDERERQLQQFKIGAQKAGKSVADIFASIGTQGYMPTTTGFRVLDQQIISDDQVILRVSIQATEPGKEQQVDDATMIKTGGEWKIDKFGPP